LWLMSSRKITVSISMHLCHSSSINFSRCVITSTWMLILNSSYSRINMLILTYPLCNFSIIGRTIQLISRSMILLVRRLVKCYWLRLN
jgi:hypothetical protein